MPKNSRKNINVLQRDSFLFLPHFFYFYKKYYQSSHRHRRFLYTDLLSLSRLRIGIWHIQFYEEGFLKVLNYLKIENPFFRIIATKYNTIKYYRSVIFCYYFIP